VPLTYRACELACLSAAGLQAEFPSSRQIRYKTIQSSWGFLHVFSLRCGLACVAGALAQPDLNLTLHPSPLAPRPSPPARLPFTTGSGLPNCRPNLAATGPFVAGGRLCFFLELVRSDMRNGIQ